MTLPTNPAPIGIFDSGYGGLTIFEKIQKQLPQYDYIYLGDNARAPYGTRSFEVVYDYTLQCVKKLFDLGCHLVILACNTASAKALRTIQQNDLPNIDPSRRVLGIIRPTSETIGEITQSKHVGLLGTSGTIQSNSYPMEVAKIFPEVNIVSHACPMWVPLIENGEHQSEGADFFIKKDIDALLSKNNNIDTLILGCTHYPLILEKIKKYLPSNINIISQGDIVGQSLKDYLNRHPEIEAKCSKNAHIEFLTTESADKFNASAALFLNKKINAKHINIL
ncbi:MAG: glutamate racemase [Paludibacteraceae bacterium]|jgi:glutamate racemase|nr:glutamate racemase [Paludibacteraceae bacterium]